jgi:hypothetical protein
VGRIMLQQGHCAYCQAPIDGVWEETQADLAVAEPAA